MPLPHTQTGFKIDLSELIRTGVYLGRFPKSVPFWSSADGIQFTPHGVKRKPGRSLIIDLGSSAVRGLMTINEFDSKVIYAGDLTTLYSYRLDTLAKDTVGSGYSLVATGGASVWDSGGSTWDSGSSVWDEGVVEADQWSFTNFGQWVLAANSAGRIQIKKDNINFNDLHSSEVSGAIVNAGGSGYVVGDTVTHTGGSGTGFATTITEVSAGAVTAFEVTNFGSGYADGETLTQNTTSGIGTGFTLDVTVPDTPFETAKIVQKAGRHILVFDYTTSTAEFPYGFAWCSEDDVDTWVAASTNSAGSLTIREATTRPQCVKPLGDGWAVYTKTQMFIINYVGAPFYFGYRQVMSTGVGAVSLNSVIPVDRLNYGMSADGIWVTDGSSVTRLGVKEGINEWLKDNVSVSEYPQVAGYHNARDKEVVWSIPVGDTKPTKELFYNYNTQTFGLRTISISAATEAGVFLNSITGDKDGQIYFEDEGSSTQTTTGTTAAHDLGDADHIKELTSIRVGKQGTGNPVIRVGWAEDANGSPTWVDSFTVNETYQEEHMRTSGRWLFLDITSSNSSDDWEISNIEVIGRIGGTR